MKRTSKEFWEEYFSINNNASTWQEKEEKQTQLRKEYYNEMEVGDHCHVCHWSDISPVTVVKRTAKTITVRFDKARLSPDWQPKFIIGGFSAHCTNNEEQEWIIEEDPSSIHTEVFRWSEVYNKFRNKSGESLFPGWLKHYDYNF